MKCKANEKLLYIHLQNCYELLYTHYNARTELDNVEKLRLLGGTHKLMGII